MALSLALMFSAYLLACAARSELPFWIGLLALGPLFVVIRGQRPCVATLYGVLWGTSTFVFSAGGNGWDAAPSSAAFLSLTTVPAAYACLGAWLTRRIGFSPFVLGVGWMAVELVLGPLGLRHGLLAATQGDGTLMNYVGQALGYVLVAFLVAYVNAALVGALGRVSLTIPARTLRVASGCEAQALRSQIVGRPSLPVLQPAHPRAPPL